MTDLTALKEHLREDIFNTYESGVKLPDGCVAFYDQRKDCFIDGASLKPLQGEATTTAAAAFAAMTPEQQLHNRSYLTFCAIYSDLERGDGQIAPAFNYATQPARSNKAEHVGHIIQRVFNSLPSLKF